MGWGGCWLYPEKVIGPAYVGFSTGVLHLSMVDKRIDHATEDHGLVDDTQEGFRRHITAAYP